VERKIPRRVAGKQTATVERGSTHIKPCMEEGGRSLEGSFTDIKPKERGELSSTARGKGEGKGFYSSHTGPIEGGVIKVGKKYTGYKNGERGKSSTLVRKFPGVNLWKDNEHATPLRRGSKGTGEKKRRSRPKNDLGGNQVP